MNEKAQYWLTLCEDDLLTANALLHSERLLHMGFFCHMIVEKALKAVIAGKTDEMPPRIHDLQRLAQYGGILGNLSQSQLDLIDKLTPLQIKARYPEYKDKIAQTLTVEYSKQLLKETEGFLCWIKQKFEK